MNLEAVHPSKDSYEIIWANIIEKELKNYKLLYIDYIQISISAQEDIWENYCIFNNYCKKTYMESEYKKIDRHKVAACYMMAILKTYPIKIVRQINGNDIPLALNERLAITVGLSLVRAFAISSIIENDTIINKEELIKKFDNGIKIPQGNLLNHGDYISNFANELNFCMKEDSLNILALAHELYLLEVITRIS